MMENNTANPQREKPVTRGRTVPLKALAIRIPRGIEINEESEPIIAAPTPCDMPKRFHGKGIQVPE